MPRPKQRSNKKFTCAFLQGWGTYANETLVVVGLPHVAILRFMKRRQFNLEHIASYKRAKPNIEADGYCWFNGGASVLWLESWEHDLAHLDTLVHETHHLVHRALGDRKGMADEMEALAYQQEFLFREIRRRLQKLSQRRKHGKGKNTRVHRST